MNYILLSRFLLDIPCIYLPAQVPTNDMPYSTKHILFHTHFSGDCCHIDRVASTFTRTVFTSHESVQIVPFHTNTIQSKGEKYVTGDCSIPMFGLYLRVICFRLWEAYAEMLGNFDAGCHRRTNELRRWMVPAQVPCVCVFARINARIIALHKAPYNLMCRRRTHTHVPDTNAAHLHRCSPNRRCAYVRLVLHGKVTFSPHFDKMYAVHSKPRKKFKCERECVCMCVYVSMWQRVRESRLQCTVIKLNVRGTRWFQVPETV